MRTAERTPPGGTAPTGYPELIRDASLVARGLNNVEAAGLLD
ncbi:hypothetical protein ACWC09_20970 [Streptomyces sp. NPDC001617]